VTHAGCRTNFLLRYFGEERDEPCGHCTWCATGVATPLPPAPALAPIPSRVDRAALIDLSRAHPGALGEPRQRARFLCGLSSPALTRAKLTRHALAGALEGRRFAEVLGWAEEGERVRG
jgi:ATP-dependent DNA helicase RecQ